MCGIFGGIKNVKPENLKILGICNEDRGTDATGFFDADTWVKDSVSFREFILADTDELIKNFKGYLVGHTRFATTGAKTTRNAHPFAFGNILGVHNGMIRNFDTLKKRHKCPELECDSEIIFYLLDKKGIEGLKEIVGYYALVWADANNPNKLYFIQHECSLAYNRGKDYLYFCTSATDLEVALGYNIKTISLDEDVLYEVDINTLKIQKTKIKGLKIDTGYVSYKSTGDYKNNKGRNWEQFKDPNWTKNEWAEDDYDRDLPPVSPCDIAYDEDEYYRDKYATWESEAKLVEKSRNRKTSRSDNYREYTIICPYCNEDLFVDEVHKGKCSFCQMELSGVIYYCYHCNSLALAEEIDEEGKCPICNLHMVLDEEHLIGMDY